MTGMNAQTPASEAVSPMVAPAGEMLAATPNEIDRSCCPALGLFFTGALKWLIIALVLGVVSSIKLHAPGFLADTPWLTYGRVYPASLNALVYGFASQAAFGVALWLLARLGRLPLPQVGAIVAGGLFWNLGLVMGILGILAGHNTGYEWLELPGYASVVMFVAYLLIGFGALMTFHLRRERALYVSQWFLLAGLLWFPWIYSTAQLLLVFGSVRGTMQAVVNGWFAHNLFSLWLTPVGLATVFYFIPKIISRPLHSRYLGLFAFWLFALFGSWGGVQASEAAPKWISSVSIVATVMTVIPVLAVAMNWYLTMAGDRPRVERDPVFRFIVVGAGAYLLASALGIAGAFRSVNDVTLFTLYESGVRQLYLYGFIGMVASGAIYYIMPRMTQCDWPSPKLIRAHFWLAVIGVAFLTVALAVGGVAQGLRAQDSSVPFLDVVRSTVPFLGLSTLGGVLLLAAHIAMALNVAKLLRSCVCCGWCSTGSSFRKSNAVSGGGR